MSEPTYTLKTPDGKTHYNVTEDRLSKLYTKSQAKGFILAAAREDGLATCRALSSMALDRASNFASNNETKTWPRKLAWAEANLAGDTSQDVRLVALLTAEEASAAGDAGARVMAEKIKAKSDYVEDKTAQIGGESRRFEKLIETAKVDEINTHVEALRAALDGLFD